MKRGFLLFASVVLLLSLFGCSTRNGFQAAELETATPVMTEAPTTVPTPSPEPTPTPTPTPVPSSWEIDNYVDDFGDKTGSAYLRGTFKGKFSNSATSGSSLTVYYFYDELVSTIRLLEYDNIKASFRSNDTVVFKFKIDDKEYSAVLSIYGGDLCFSSVSNDSASFFALKGALKDGKTIKCVVKSTKYGDTYNFTMDGNGFKETLEEAGLH